ncbi:hypothetical protein L3Y34_006774 [Caenorhabditis briggsae]|uniref:Uncharacterized protein n=1 Tax=Caenorhabditis briggsae TaxID=6238 RepID=A0AAE9CYV1_CAEBR|nr:hypothetical protein L3Y34_006774 [Caenorhabditis briggsae]
MQAGVLGFYLSTSMMTDQYLLAGSRHSFINVFLGGFFLNGWFMECLVQIVMAVNRFTVITLNEHYIFTSNTTLIIFFFLTTTTVFSVVCTQNLFPCCKYLLQFVLISIFYVLAWVLFEILPFIVPADQPQWYAVIPFFGDTQLLFQCNHLSVTQSRNSKICTNFLAHVENIPTKGIKSNSFYSCYH